VVLVRDPKTQGSFRPTLGPFTAITLIIGSMIGSGIFRLPADMMEAVKSPGMLLLVWVVGGLFTICGALTFAELAGMFPQAGGQYAFMRAALGKKWAFLYGWTFFWVVQTGIIAGVALVFAEFTRRVFGYSGFADPTVAVLCIVSLTVINYFGSKFGGVVQNVFTIAKVGGLLTLVVAGFLVGDPTHPMLDQEVDAAPTGFALFSAFFSAMLLALFALDGWPYAATVAPEIKNPKRNVPRAMIIGVSAVTIIYILSTAVYLYLVPANDIVAIGQGGPGGPIAAAAANVFAGEIGAKLISAAVMISTFGTVNAFILTSPRIYYAVAEDGMFPKRFSLLNPKTNTPGYAMIVQGTWAGLLICLARFSADAYTAIVSGVVFCIWLFYVPTVIGYFRLRIKKPDLPRPYRTTFYPVTPIVFLIAGLLVVGNQFYASFTDLFTKDLDATVIANLTAIWGSLAVLLGLPFVLKWRAMEKRGEPSPAQGGSVFDS
jgi:basic amino acid/polyamine antiporter, APA family